MDMVVIKVLWCILWYFMVLVWHNWYMLWYLYDILDTCYDTCMIHLIHVMIHVWYNWYMLWYVLWYVYDTIDTCYGVFKIPLWYLYDTCTILVWYMLWYLYVTFMILVWYNVTFYNTSSLFLLFFFPFTHFSSQRVHRKLNLPIIITENGIADAKDDRRHLFIRRYLYALSRAMRDGAIVKGYFYWSLYDNFEWAEGYKMRFGLYEVDYGTQERRLRDGAKYFVEVVKRFRGIE